MYVRALGGTWFSHPFWKTRFKLTSQADVDRLRASDVPYVEIDDALGIGLGASELCEPAAPDDAALPAHLAPEGQSGRLVMRRASGGPDRALLARSQAARTVTRAKAVMQEMFAAARLGQNIPTAEAAKLVDEIDHVIATGERALLDVVRMKRADEYTYLHSVAVCALMLTLARHIGLAPTEVRECGLAGLLHDVGKMKVPPEILHKQGPLSDSEFACVKTHAQQGYEVLCEAADLPAAVLVVARFHHEKIDGTGYPLGLSGDQIPLVARMGAICDVYDALTSNRAYKQAWAPARALAAMAQWPGHFDRQLLSSFVQCLDLEGCDFQQATPCGDKSPPPHAMTDKQPDCLPLRARD